MTGSMPFDLDASPNVVAAAALPFQKDKSQTIIPSPQKIYKYINKKTRINIALHIDMSLDECECVVAGPNLSSIVSSI